jgi:hypothetical protein
MEFAPNIEHSYERGISMQKKDLRPIAVYDDDSFGEGHQRVAGGWASGARVGIVHQLNRREWRSRFCFGTACLG